MTCQSLVMDGKPNASNRVLRFSGSPAEVKVRKYVYSRRGMKEEMLSCNVAVWRGIVAKVP